MEKFRSSFGEIELTDEREEHIFKFHPEVRAYKKYFTKTLSHPDVVRRSKFDPKVLILYKHIVKHKYLAVVIKTNQRSFILTAYLTDKIQHQLL